MSYDVVMKKFAAFDIDGTLIRWQLYHTIVDKLAEEGQLGIGAQSKLHEARMRWKKREYIDAFHDYEAILVGIYEDALPSIDPEVFDRFVVSVIEEYKDQVYTFTRDLAKQLKADGYFLLAISGSHHELVGELAKYYGFDDYLGAIYERKNGTFSGQKDSPVFDKNTALKKLVEKNKLSFDDSYAIGDSQSDAAMLKLVKNPIAFNPDRNLFEIAQKNAWSIIIERKNVIYKLEAHNGNYTLGRN